MKWNWTTDLTYKAALVIILLLVGGRFMMGDFDFSYFFVGGSDFIDSSATPISVKVQPGQGYDGQFFYRFALNPFDFSKVNYGVTVDLVPYRIQRIGYPLLAWLFSLGGNAALVPFALIFVNVLAFIGTLRFTQKIILFFNGLSEHSLLPLLLCGIYMSIARDLSEVTELFFFSGAIYYFLKSSFVTYSFYAMAAILCRETSIVAFIPLTSYLLISTINNDKGKIPGILFIAWPFFAFVLWKLIIAKFVDDHTAIQGSGNLGLPFVGMINGFKGNLDFSSVKKMLELGFWIMYFFWQIWFIIKIVRTINEAWKQKQTAVLPLSLIYLSWLLFALFLSAAIYIDDWSFVRVFSLWNMCGFFILIATKKKTGLLFMGYSLLLVALTLGRLIIRP